MKPMKGPVVAWGLLSSLSPTRLARSERPYDNENTRGWQHENTQTAQGLPTSDHRCHDGILPGETMDRHGTTISLQVRQVRRCPMKLKDAILQACKNQGIRPPHALTKPYVPEYHSRKPLEQTSSLNVHPAN